MSARSVNAATQLGFVLCAFGVVSVRGMMALWVAPKEGTWVGWGFAALVLSATANGLSRDIDKFSVSPGGTGEG